MRRVLFAAFAGVVGTLLLLLAFAGAGFPPEAGAQISNGISALQPPSAASPQNHGVPALMVALGVLALVPLLVIAGRFMKDGQQNAHQESKPARRRKTNDEISNWPSDAWIEVEGVPNRFYKLGRGLVRIGRDEENDIPIPERTVHRVHAIIHRTEEAQFIITDVSSRNGRGVSINGRPVHEASLRPGDAISLGQVTLKFIARPA